MSSSFSSVSDPDPFVSVSFRPAGSGKQKISQNHGKFPQKSAKITRISYICSKILNFCLTDINIYLINIFLIGKKEKKSWYFLHFRSDLDALFHETDPRIRIKMKRIQKLSFR